MESEDVHKPLSKMEYRQLGNSGLKVSAISLGGWLTYGGYVDEEKTFACLKTAWDHGINFFDTAEGYGGGTSEIVMGKAIRHFNWPRCDIVISTKINFGHANSCSPHRAQNTVGLSRKHVFEGVRTSLKRLDLEYVDLIYAHRPDRLTPMEEVVRAFNHVIDRGWAFYWGTSMWEADEIAEAWRVADRLGLIGPVMEQPKYNLLCRDKVEREFAPLYPRAGGLGLTVFSPLELGILSGKYNDLQIPEGSRFSQSGDPYIKSVRAKFNGDDSEMKYSFEASRGLGEIAKELGVPQSQLAIAWILKNHNVSSIITGASRPEQVVENVKAVEVVEKLTPEVMARIEDVVKNKLAALERRIGMP